MHVWPSCDFNSPNGFYTCPKGTRYQDVFIYIKFYISMLRLDNTYEDLHARKSRFQHTNQDLCTHIKIHLQVHEV